jgi:galactose mutarotase-like enzyme
MMIDPTPDTEISLSFDTQRALVSPWGASLRRYFTIEADGGETDILWGYSGGGQKKGGQGDVLFPFPGRIAEGRYSFDGQALQLERTTKKVRMRSTGLSGPCRGRSFGSTRPAQNLKSASMLNRMPSEAIRFLS